MQRSSLHNHTVFCDGKNTIEEMLAAAERAGITDFGVSRHTDVELILGKAPISEEDYISKINALKQRNSRSVRLWLGTEEDLFVPVKDRSKYDYVIGSVHYFKSGDELFEIDYTAERFEEGLVKAYGGDGLACAEGYYESVLACAKLRPDILGHFDLLRKCGGAFIDFNGKKYRDLALSCAEACLAEDVIFELNYGAIARKKLTEPYPTDELLTLIKQKKGRVTLSTDCHNAEYIALGLSEGEEKLRSLGFTSLTEFSCGEFKERKL